MTLFVVNRMNGDYEFEESVAICSSQADAEEMALAYHEADIYNAFCERMYNWGQTLPIALKYASDNCFDYVINKANLI